MRVLLMLPYDWDTMPSQRFRIEQWAPWLRAHGVHLDVSTLLSHREQQLLYRPGNSARKGLMLAAALGRRLVRTLNTGGYDAVWLHRAASPVGPALIERMLARRGVPIIYEFDDAIYLADTSAANARWRFLKCAGKTADICRMSAHVVVGNNHLSQYAGHLNSNVTVIPTTIDTDRYQACCDYADTSPVVIGWSGSRTTVAHLRMLDSVLQRVATQADVRLHVLGTPSYPLAGVQTYAAPWTAEAELPELQRFHIGIMPLPDQEWARGKCALKALQYMALGIPTVTAPVGVNADLIQDGENGCLAATDDEWVERLLSLVRDARLRRRLGLAGRSTVDVTYSTRVQAPRVYELLERVCRTVKSPGAGKHLAVH